MLSNSSHIASKPFYFSEANFVKFQKKVVSINKKIRKDNAYAKQIEYSAMNKILPFEQVWGFKPCKGWNSFVNVVEVEFKDEYTRYYVGENTRIIGVIDHKNDLIYGDMDILEHYRYRTECDHCHRKIHRNKTLIIETEMDGIKVDMQVGGDCVREYTGIDLALLAQILDIQAGSEFHETEYKGYSGNFWYSLNEVVCRTIACIDKYGFESKNNGLNPNATVYRIESSYSRDQNAERFEYGAEIEEKAENLLEMLRNMEPRTNFDYNVRGIACREDGFISEKHFPYIVAAVGMNYRRDNSEYSGNEWIGEVGNSIDLNLNVMNVKTVNGRFGSQILYEMKDSNGNKVVWFTSRDAYSIGDRLVFINGTVKKHSEYRGIKSTVIGGKGMKVSLAS